MIFNKEEEIKEKIIEKSNLHPFRFYRRKYNNNNISEINDNYPQKSKEETKT